MTTPPVPANVPHDPHLTEDAVRRIVRETVLETLTTLGLDVSEPEKIIAVQADMAYLRKSRIGADEVMKWAKRSLLGTALAAITYATWDGIVAAIRAKLGGP